MQAGRSTLFRSVAAAVAALVIPAGAGCTGAPEPPDAQSPTTAVTAPPVPAYAAVLEKYSKDMRAAGATAVVIEVKSRVGGWSSAEGVRSLDTNEPVQLTDQTHAGDITMTMVAVSVLKLVEEGKIGLDDPIQKHLPDLEGIVKPPGPITIGSLLSHRSGMPDYRVSPVEVGNRRSTHEERISYVAAMPWTGGSGSLFSFSATNYSVLALLLEKLRGQNLSAVIRADNVEPLGLQDTLMAGDEPGPRQMIHGYTKTVSGELEDTALSPVHSGSPDTGVISTVPELNTYFAALQKGTLLTAQTVAEMHHPKFQTYGLGVVRHYDSCSNNDYYGHVGVVQGYAALALISADGSRQIAMAVARAPKPGPVGFGDSESYEMEEAAAAALDQAC